MSSVGTEQQELNFENDGMSAKLAGQIANAEFGIPDSVTRADA